MEREEMREAATPSTPRGEMFQEGRGEGGRGGEEGREMLEVKEGSE